MIPISGSFLTAAIILALLAVLVVLLAGGIVVIVMVLRREKSQQRRSSREIEKINALAAAGKITAEEASQLRQAVMPYAMPIGAPPPDTHIKQVAILNIVLSVLKITGGVVVAVVLIMAKTHAHVDPRFPWQNMLLLLPVGILVMVLVLEGLRIFAAIAVQKRQAWARTTLIVLAVLSLLNFPFGTAVGGYTLWVLLLREGAAAWFEPPAV
ncbi:MAG: hypothetical protein NTV22_13475 [bacterium]|nr:hypothetical protein [bacterium]